jgi:hypothetical protein
LRDTQAAVLANNSGMTFEAAQKAVEADTKIDSIDSTFNAVFKIPAGLDVSGIADNVTLTLLDSSNTLFKINSASYNSTTRELTVPMKLNSSPVTLGDLITALEGVRDKDNNSIPLTVDIPGLTVDSNTAAGDLKVIGTLSGGLEATVSGNTNTYALSYSYTGVQSDGGKDAVAQTEPITLTLRNVLPTPPTPGTENPGNTGNNGGGSDNTPSGSDPVPDTGTKNPVPPTAVTNPAVPAPADNTQDVPQYFDLNNNPVTIDFPGEVYDAKGGQVKGASRGYDKYGNVLGAERTGTTANGNVPKTGDDFNLSLILALLAVSVSGVLVCGAAVLKIRRRKR